MLTATVDFPTPPLPEPIATALRIGMFIRPRMRPSLGTLESHLIDDGFHASHGGHRLPGLLLDLTAQRAGRRGQHDREGDLAALDFQIPNHVQSHQVLMQFGLLHLAQGRQDLFFAHGICHVVCLFQSHVDASAPAGAASQLS